jgi:hypothetical protein
VGRGGGGGGPCRTVHVRKEEGGFDRCIELFVDPRVGVLGKSVIGGPVMHARNARPGPEGREWRRVDVSGVAPSRGGWYEPPVTSPVVRRGRNMPPRRLQPIVCRRRVGGSRRGGVLAGQQPGVDSDEKGGVTGCPRVGSAPRRHRSVIGRSTDVCMRCASHGIRRPVAPQGPQPGGFERRNG